MLFSEEEIHGVDDSPLDDTKILVTYLYFSEEDKKEFHALAKEGMKKEWPDNFQEEGNLSDLILKALKKLYGKPSESIDAETSPVGQASGSPEREVSY